MEESFHGGGTFFHGGVFFSHGAPSAQRVRSAGSTRGRRQGRAGTIKWRQVLGKRKLFCKFAVYFPWPLARGRPARAGIWPKGRLAEAGRLPCPHGANAVCEGDYTDIEFHTYDRHS